MGWASDRGADGRRFDSRRAQTTFLGPLGNELLCIFTYVGAGLGYFLGRRFGRVGVTFWSGWGHFLVDFGMSWDVSGSGQGTFSDGFGMVLEKCLAGSKHRKIQK